MIYYYPPKPMYLSANSSFLDQLDKNPDWIAEEKYNGWRMLVYKENNVLSLWTRNSTMITDAFPEIRKQLDAMVPEGSILDGELVSSIRVKGTPEKVVLFDIIQIKYNYLGGVPLSERRKVLEKLVKESDVVQLTKWVRVGKRKMFEDIMERKDPLVEGIVLKNIHSGYLASVGPSSRKTPHWLKVKFSSEEDKEE